MSVGFVNLNSSLQGATQCDVNCQGPYYHGNNIYFFQSSGSLQVGHTKVYVERSTNGTSWTTLTTGQPDYINGTNDFLGMSVSEYQSGGTHFVYVAFDLSWSDPSIHGGSAIETIDLWKFDFVTETWTRIINNSGNAAGAYPWTLIEFIDLPSLVRADATTGNCWIFWTKINSATFQPIGIWSMAVDSTGSTVVAAAQQVALPNPSYAIYCHNAFINNGTGAILYEIRQPSSTAFTLASYPALSTLASPVTPVSRQTTHLLSFLQYGSTGKGLLVSGDWYWTSISSTYTLVVNKLTSGGVFSLVDTGQIMNTCKGSGGDATLGNLSQIFMNGATLTIMWRSYSDPNTTLPDFFYASWSGSSLGTIHRMTGDQLGNGTGTITNSNSYCMMPMVVPSSGRLGLVMYFGQTFIDNLAWFFPAILIAIACPVGSDLATVGTLFTSNAPVVTGDTPPDVYALLSGPAWMSIDAATGVVSGIPTTPGTFTYVIQVTDNLGNVASTAPGCTVTVGPASSSPPAGSTPKPILKPNKFDFCLHREYRLFCNIDYQRLGCAKLPHCFTVDEREWGEQVYP